MSSGLSMKRPLEVLAMLFIAGPILGIGLYLVNLPFGILGFVSPFFRKRLRGFLSLKSEAATAMPTDATHVADF